MPEADAVAGFRAISVPTLLVAGEVDQVGHPGRDEARRRT